MALRSYRRDARAGVVNAVSGCQRHLTSKHQHQEAGVPAPAVHAFETSARAIQLFRFDRQVVLDVRNTLDAAGVLLSLLLFRVRRHHARQHDGAVLRRHVNVPRLGRGCPLQVQP